MTISPGCREQSVADTLDTITNNHHYRKARPFTESKEEICRGTGTQLNPAVVNAYKRIATSLLLRRTEQTCLPIHPSG